MTVIALKPMSKTTDYEHTPETELLDRIHKAIESEPLERAEQVLAYMLAIVASRRRQNLPTAGTKVEVAELIGRALDHLIGEPDSP